MVGPWDCPYGHHVLHTWVYLFLHLMNRLKYGLSTTLYSCVTPIVLFGSMWGDYLFLEP